MNAKLRIKGKTLIICCHNFFLATGTPRPQPKTNLFCWINNCWNYKAENFSSSFTRFAMSVKDFYSLLYNRTYQEVFIKQNLQNYYKYKKLQTIINQTKNIIFSCISKKITCLFCLLEPIFNKYIS